jgi:hypothetical protein
MTLATHSGMPGFWEYITRTYILEQVFSWNAWTFYLCDGLDVILTGRGVPGPVDWTGLGGFQKATHQARLAFSIQHALFEHAI